MILYFKVVFKSFVLDNFGNGFYLIAVNGSS